MENYIRQEMEFRKQTRNEAPTYKPTQTGASGRSSNEPILGNMDSEFYSYEALPEVEMSSQYQNPLKPSDATFAHTSAAPRNMQPQRTRRLSPERVEPEDYYGNYNAPTNSPVPELSDAHPIYEQLKQTRAYGRSLNKPTLGNMDSEFYSYEALPDAEMSLQYQNPLKLSYAAFTHTNVAPHNMQPQRTGRLSPERVEPEDYYGNYNAPPNSPVPELSDAHPIYEQSFVESMPIRDQLDETIYEDIVDEEEDESDACVYESYPPQEERYLRREEYFPAREVTFCEPYATQQRRYRKSPLSNCDVQQPTFSGTTSQVRSPTRLQMSEPIHSGQPQKKQVKLATRSCYDAEGRLYPRSPTEIHSNGRRTLDLQSQQEIKKRLEELEQRKIEGLRQIHAKRVALQRHGAEEPIEPLQEFPSSKELAEGEEYFKNLKALFQEVSEDLRELITTKEAELKMKKERKNSSEKNAI